MINNIENINNTITDFIGSIMYQVLQHMIKAIHGLGLY